MCKRRIIKAKNLIHHYCVTVPNTSSIMPFDLNIHQVKEGLHTLKVAQVLSMCQSLCAKSHMETYLDTHMKFLSHLTKISRIN